MLTPRLVLFLATLGLMLALLGTHVVRRLGSTFVLSRRVRLFLITLLVAGVAASFGSRLLSTYSPAAARALGTFGGGVSLAIILSSVLLWPYEIWRGLRGLSAVVRHVGSGYQSARPGPDSLAAAAVSADAQRHAPGTPARREFLQQAAVGGAVSLGAGSALYGTLIGRHDYAIEDVPVALAKLPRTLDGFRIVQISDIHVGLYVGEFELSRALTLIRDARPDAIVMTGDLVDNDIRYAALLARFTRKLEGVARHGVYAIAGNHDHYTGVQAVYQHLREAGAEVLHNRHVRIGQAQDAFVLAGVDDVTAARYRGQGPDLVQAFAGATPDLARVLLSHNPSYFPTAKHAADLVLSGHTHGGQITLFINPAELVLQHGYIRGLYRNGESQIYVNRGFGTAGPPARVGSAPEITRLTLTRA